MKKITKTLIFLALLQAACMAVADIAPGQYKDKTIVTKVLSAIPMEDKDFGYKSLAERLPNLGLEVIRVDIYALTNEEIKASRGQYKSGDIDYQFNTTPPHNGLLSVCPILPTFSFIKRGNRWLPSTRTAVFLVRNRCDTPKF